MIGEILKGRYKIVEILSSGGFCQTYLAQDTSQPDSLICVVKHLSIAASPQPQTLATLRHLFTREAQALEKLGNHKQVPQLLDHFEANQEFYLVQQFIPGHPLNVELQPTKPWSESQVIELLQEVLGILEYVHNHGLIHRDIKPSNLIRRSTDQRIVLIDFGSVKQVWTQVVTAQGKTSTKFVEGIPATIAIGTPGYMPTEQGRGRPRPNSDIYAVGMIGIQALTGRNPSQLLEDSETGEIIWQNHADVSPQLAHILNKMVRYHFKDRYQSVTEVNQALQPLVAQLYAASPAVAVVGTQRRTVSASNSKPQTVSSVAFKRSPTEAATNIGNTTVANSENKLAMLMGLAMGVTSAVALIIGSYYYLRPLTPTEKPSPNSPAKVQPNSVAIPSQRASTAKITPVRTLDGHSNGVWSVAVSPDSQILVSASEDKTIKIWHLDTGKLLRTLTGNSERVLSVVVSPDGQSLISGNFAAEQAIKIWQLPTGELRHTLSKDAHKVWSVAISPDGQSLASTSSDQTIKIWQLSTGELRQNLVGHSDTVWSVTISPDGQTLASGSWDQTVKLWNLPTGKLLHTLSGHSDRVRSVAISPDSQTIASSSWDRTIKIWNLPTGKLLHTLSGHSGYVNSIAISPDGQTVASGSDDNTIKLWNLQTGELLSSFSAHTSNINSVTFNADGKILVSGSNDKTIKIWKL